MLFHLRRTKHILNITWSQLNDPSPSKRSTVCTREDRRREHTILYSMLPLCLIFTKSVTVSATVSKWESFYKVWSESQRKVLLRYLTISTNVRMLLTRSWSQFCLSSRQCTSASSFELLQRKTLNFLSPEPRGKAIYRLIDWVGFNVPLNTI